MTIELPVAFLIALYALNSSAIVAFVGIVVYLALRLGRLPTRQEHNELRNELKSDLAEFRREYKEDMAEFRREYKEDMVQLRQEHREDMVQLRQELVAEFRRSHQQLMLALVSHSHGADGQAMFTAPPEMETTPTPADN